MKRGLVFYFLLVLSSATAQTPGQWVWLSGDSSGSFLGNFGIQGVPSPNNVPPALYEACEWTDRNGNFWLYGGVGINTNTYAALWKYDPITNEWTWMKGPSSTSFVGNYGTLGVSSPTNLPPCRFTSLSWADEENNLWFYGGIDGYWSGNYGDLWKYNIGTNEWTWMDVGQFNPIYGSLGIPDTGNTPGFRGETAASWHVKSADGENLWLFGGDNGNGGRKNDLWKYNIQNKTWTWVKGDSSANQPGIYGAREIENSLNVPGGRWVYSKWKDEAGNFWVFGGNNNSGAVNDLWRYNPLTNNWTWMNGSNYINAPSDYGNQCITTQTNIPGRRYENRIAWTDDNWNFWTFGGTYPGPMNDLWLYCTSINQWVWVSNDTGSTTTCNWGVKGVPSPTNKPGSRWGGISWFNQNGHLYLFGGLGFYAGSSVNNDLWMYTIDTACYCPTALEVEKNKTENPKLSIYPNPTSGTFKIQTPQLINSQLEIFNMLGEKIYSDLLRDENIELNARAGIYFVRVSDGEKVYTEKVVIE
jgi:hypothetical protein